MSETAWLIIGFLGQGCFFLRFLVQWISSEKAKRSVIPVAFWYFSLAGASIVLVYAIYRRDPVFIVGQTTGFFIYLRNLVFIYRERDGNGDSSRSELSRSPDQNSASPSTGSNG